MGLRRMHITCEEAWRAFLEVCRWSMGGSDCVKQTQYSETRWAGIVVDQGDVDAEI